MLLINRYLDAEPGFIVLFFHGEKFYLARNEEGNYFWPSVAGQSSLSIVSFSDLQEAFIIFRNIGTKFFNWPADLHYEVDLTGRRIPYTDWTETLEVDGLAPV